MYEDLIRKFNDFYHKPAQFLFSAPGRTELSGNHTDHQLGKVLAGAVNLDTTAAVALNGEPMIRMLSEGRPLFEISLDSLAVRPEETGRSAALIRGVAAGFSARGFSIPGFDAYVTSRVLPGSGLSSSAAFEVMLGTILNHLTGARLTALEVAQIGQYAENVYFGKPCGLLDQAASSLGGVITIDFADEKNPRVEHLELVKASGRSSWMYLQNVIPAGYKQHQDLAVALALAEKLLDGSGACRVHGGGFAGTIQAFVPFEKLDGFRAGIEAVLGEGSCHVLSIRAEGGIMLEEL